MDTVVKLRGLPWSCKDTEIVDFLSDCTIKGGAEGVHIMYTPEGRASGEAYVEVETEEDLKCALEHDKKSIGHRYIEVFKVRKSEMEYMLRRLKESYTYMDCGGYDKKQVDDCETFVRLRGLPFECTKEEIVKFFDGLEIEDNGIQLMVNAEGRSTGEAYVQFRSSGELTAKEMAEKAIARDRQCIGHRYIEVFRVSEMELRNMDMMAARQRPTYMRPSPYDKGARGPRPPPNMVRYPPRLPRYYDRKSGNGHYEDEGWDMYGNEGHWGRGGRPRPLVPPPPPPLLPQLMKRPMSGGPVPLGGGYPMYSVLMRGLPFKASDDDIRKFFSPLNPSDIRIMYEASGRPSGNAKVFFASKEDMTKALGKHKERMEHRYIEIFSNQN